MSEVKPFFEPEDAVVIVEVCKKHLGKPVVDVPAGGEGFTLVRKVLQETSIPSCNLPEKAAGALKALRICYQIIAKAKG